MTDLQICEEVGVLENSIFLPVYMLYFVHTVCMHMLKMIN